MWRLSVSAQNDCLNAIQLCNSGSLDVSDFEKRENSLYVEAGRSAYVTLIANYIPLGSARRANFQPIRPECAL